MSTVTDDTGTSFALPTPVRRVVSLVPSLTESVAATDRSALVAVTDWCTHPGDLDVPRIRGTKNPNLAEIIALRPDLVLANKEENRELDVTRLRDAGIPVWVTVTEDVAGALTALTRLFGTALRWDVPEWLARATREWSAPPAGPRLRVAIPIWRDPWMVVGRDTFTGSLAAHLGLVNVFDDAEGRYPHVDGPGAIEAAGADVVLLPDEPYAFSATDGPEAFTVPTALVEGRALTWYGPSLLTARAEIERAVAARS